MGGATFLGFALGAISNQVSYLKRETPEAARLRKAVTQRAAVLEAAIRLDEARLDQGGRLLRAAKRALELDRRTNRVRKPNERTDILDAWDDTMAELEAAYYAVPVQSRNDADAGIRVPAPVVEDPRAVDLR